MSYSLVIIIMLSIIIIIIIIKIIMFPVYYYPFFECQHSPYSDTAHRLGAASDLLLGPQDMAATWWRFVYEMELRSFCPQATDSLASHENWSSALRMKVQK